VTALAAPHDARPRLILADWLEEAGFDPPVHRALRLAAADHSWWYIDSDGQLFWQFPLTAVLPPAVVPISGQGGGPYAAGHAWAEIGFAKIPYPPCCHRCRSRGDIVFGPDSATWACVDGLACRPPSPDAPEPKCPHCGNHGPAYAAGTCCYETEAAG
jgi:uncharacterized protein (TIGR02996 family)